MDKVVNSDRSQYTFCIRLLDLTSFLTCFPCTIRIFSSILILKKNIDKRTIETEETDLSTFVFVFAYVAWRKTIDKV